MELMLLTSLLAAASLLALFLGILNLQSHRNVRERLDLFLVGQSVEPVTLQDIELSRPFSERIILPLARQAARFFGWMLPQNRLNALRNRLQLAGNPANLNAADFTGVKGIMMLALLGFSLLFLFVSGQSFSLFNLLVVGLVALIGFFLPDAWLSRRMRRRQKEILYALPDALDLLTITVEAGLSFESGLQEIVNKSRTELSREFARVLRDIGMGQSRRQALSALAERCDVQDLSRFVSALNQSEELGISISRILRIQSDEMRIRRRQLAQEKANQTPIKMMIPLVFLIFPALFAVLLGPAVPQILETLGAMGG